MNPILSEDVKCFGADDCYALVFGIPGVLMTVAAFGLLAGKRFSVCVKPEGNSFNKICGCVWVI